ncbi:MAG: DUF2865 domain-containing protein [Beijerinckiaceae bacterium]|jgi:hypothetical protein|nr:DUF2865 domain-containing protein [Beijerinckiaceae bacterium]
MPASKAKGSMRAGNFLFPGMGLLLAGLFALTVATPSHAQPAMCNTIRAELANLPRSNAGGNPREAARLRSEIANARNAMRANGCDQPRGFFGLGSAPAVCAPLAAQTQQMEARLRQTEPADANAPRRAQLLAAYQRYGCDGAQQAAPQRGVIYAQPQEPGILERLFGSSATVDQRRETLTTLDPEFDEELKEKARLGGRTPVCVRTCDGFFFPVNFEGLTARDEHGQVCQALCPGAETMVMYMRLGAEIETAATRDGQAYTSYPFALKYRENRDNACFCRPPGYTAAQLAKGQEDLVETRKGDLVVTREQAEAMSRPKEVRGAAQQRQSASARNTRNAPAPAPAAEEPAPIPDAAIPTAGTASAGIGPRLGSERVLNGGQGQMQEVIGADGLRRQVRVVAPAPNAPEPQPALRGATRPSTPAPARAP